MGIGDAVLAKVENRRRKYRARMAFADAVDQMVKVTDAAAGDNGYSVSIEALVGSSNVWVGASADLNSAGDDGVSVGYLFKNVVAGIDATAFVGSNDGYGIIARRSLNEVVAGLEGRIVWGQEGGSNTNSFVYELAYNVNSKYQVAVSIADANGVDTETSVTVRYNF